MLEGVFLQQADNHGRRKDELREVETVGDIAEGRSDGFVRLEGGGVALLDDLAVRGF